MRWRRHVPEPRDASADEVPFEEIVDAGTIVFWVYLAAGVLREDTIENFPALIEARLRARDLVQHEPNGNGEELSVKNFTIRKRTK